MDTERTLFLRLEQLMDSERLFLDTSLRRDDVCRLLGIDKNTLATLIREHSGCQNLQVYINCWRVRYAARLMARHPELTTTAIIRMCGMAYSSTFNRTFREFYGQTPSEYRKKLQTLYMQ